MREYQTVVLSGIGASVARGVARDQLDTTSAESLRAELQQSASCLGRVSRQAMAALLAGEHVYMFWGGGARPPFL